jgi:membrane protease subunit HflC
MKRLFYVIAAAVVFVLLLRSIIFTVDETQYAIVTRLGNPKRVEAEPGLRSKLPAPLETVLFLDKRLLVFDPPGAEFLTADKKNIIADAYLCWRIKDPLRFIQTVNTKAGAEARLVDLVSSELGVSLGKYALSSLISVNPEEVKISQMMEGVKKRCDEAAKSEYGIEVVDVRLKRINFPEQNKQSVFARMMAERERIAKKYRAEGEEQALKIAAETDKQEKQIMSESYREAQKLKGEGEAEAARIYSQAYGKDPKFYRLLRTLEAYKKFMDEKTTVILSSDSKLLELLMQGDERGGKQ